MQPLLLSVQDASEYSGLSVDVIKGEVINGNLDYVITDKRQKVLIHRVSLDNRVAEMARVHEVISPTQARKTYREIKASKKKQ